MPNIFHSRKACFSVRCHDRGLEQQIVDRLVGLRQQRIKCVIVSPDVDASGEHPASVSVDGTMPPPPPPSSSLLTLSLTTSLPSRTGRGASIAHLDWIDVKNVGRNNDDEEQDDNDDDNDDDEEYLEEEVLGDVNNNNTTSDHTVLQVYQYDVYVEFDVAPGKTSRRWAFNYFIHGTPMPSVAAVSVPRVLGDNVIVTYMQRPHAVYGEPTLDKAATLNLLMSRFDSKEQASEVKEAIERYYHAPFTSNKVRDEIYCTWRAETGIVPTPRRLQAERCTRPEDLRAESPDEWKHPFIHTEGTARSRWVDQYIGKGPLLHRQGYKPLVLCSTQSRTGKTHWARSLGPHIYMHRTLNQPLIHDCVSDGEAQYIVLDDIPWPVLFNESSIGPAVLSGQREYSWKHGKDTMTTHCRLPVIVLNNYMPTAWGKRGEKYWKPNLQMVKLSGTALFDVAKMREHGPGVAVPTSSLSPVSPPHVAFPPSSPPSSTSPPPVIPPRAANSEPADSVLAVIKKTKPKRKASGVTTEEQDSNKKPSSE
jgi:hypothetical protein